MAENNRGVRKILASPLIYKGLRDILGLNRWMRTFLAEYVRPKGGEKILDIGCGTGEIVRYLPDCDYVGIDRHRPYIEQAQLDFGKKGRFICADISDHIDEFSHSFDLVTANGILHHLDDPLATRLFDISRQVLRPGGRLVTVDPCFYQGQAAITRFIINQDRGQNVRPFEQYGKLAHQSFEEIEEYLWHGFAPIPFSVAIIRCHAPTPAGDDIS